VLQVAPEPVQLPEHERVAGLQRLEAGEEAGPGVIAAGGKVLVNALGPDAGGEQGVALRRERLAAVALRDSGVADENGRGITRKERAQGATWRS